MCNLRKLTSEVPGFDTSVGFSSVPEIPSDSSEVGLAFRMAEAEKCLEKKMARVSAGSLACSADGRCNPDVLFISV